MSFSEILQELPRLTNDERQSLYLRLASFNVESDFEETPEMLAGIDEGARSLDEEESSSTVEARRRLSQWITK